MPRPRITGLIYFLYFVTTISAQFFIRGLIVSGDAVATANNILSHQPSFRLGAATGLIATALYVALAAMLYELLKPVDRSVSLVAAFVSLTGCAIQVLGSVLQLAPLLVLGGRPYLSTFTAEQLRTLAMLFLQLRIQADNISLVFFGFYCLLLGYLIFRSAFLPPFLGVLLILAGLGWLSFLSPPLASQLSPYILILGFVSEMLLMLWLLVIGVKVQRWKEQVTP